MKLENSHLRALCAALVATLSFSCGGEAPPTSREPQPQAEPRAPLVQKAEVVDWCKEHVVPESVCTRCNASLVATFQEKGDWCKEHGLPESQCIECHPELKAKFEAMAPKTAGK